MNYAQNNFKDTQAKIDGKANWPMFALAIVMLVGVSALFAHALGG